MTFELTRVILLIKRIFYFFFVHRINLIANSNYIVRFFLFVYIVKIPRNRNQFFKQSERERESDTLLKKIEIKKA